MACFHHTASLVGVKGVKSSKAWSSRASHKGSPFSASNHDHPAAVPGCVGSTSTGMVLVPSPRHHARINVDASPFVRSLSAR